MTRTSILERIVLAATLVVVAPIALAQSQAKSPAATATTVTTTTSTVPQAPDEGRFDSRETRREFHDLLQRHPREVGVMLKLDPSLFRNEAWMSSYPVLRDYVARHPEVAQNAAYFLDDIWIPGDEAPEPAAVRATRDMMGGLAMFAVMLIVIATLSWLIRTLLEHRRWSRVSKAQTEIYNKLLDRFTSHEDLLRYVESSAGKDFISAASAPPLATAPAVAAPIGRILWSAQAGIILMAIGVGLQYISGRLHPDVAGSSSILGVLALCAGIGALLSGIVAYVISRRLGIIPAPHEAETGATPSRTLGE